MDKKEKLLVENKIRNDKGSTTERFKKIVQRAMKNERALKEMSNIREQLIVIIPVLNDLPAGIIKLGDLVNSVARKPKVEEFETFLYNLFSYGSP